MFAVNGILFNHESPRRGDTFVTRKITRSVAKIELNMMQSFELGNLDAERDWGHAKDYVQAMHLMLQEDSPQDFVVASGEKHSVREFVELAFQCVGRTIQWSGSGLEEVGTERETRTVRVRVNAKYFRPSEVVSSARLVFHVLSSSLSPLSSPPYPSLPLPLTTRVLLVSRLICGTGRRADLCV